VITLPDPFLKNNTGMLFWYTFLHYVEKHKQFSCVVLLSSKRTVLSEVIYGIEAGRWLFS
jgi:hypothetical protein